MATRLTCYKIFTQHLIRQKLHQTIKTNPFLFKTVKTNQYHKRTMSYGVPLESVVNALEKIASSKLAEDWDNVGLLVEPTLPHAVQKLFLTNDLTEEVLNEAISKNVNMILSYHPPLFSSVKRLRQGKWKDRILVKALENRIAIFSPHTSYDSIKGNIYVNDFILQPEEIWSKTADFNGLFDKIIKGGVNDWLISCFNGEVKPIVPNVENPENGMGRICNLNNPMHIDDVIANVKKHLSLKHLRVAYSRNKMIETIASCAGSGSSILRDVQADLYLTGEMSHHDILDAVSNNITVILCEHSNTERGFMKTLAPIIIQLLDESVEVLISERDKDPIEIV